MDIDIDTYGLQDRLIYDTPNFWGSQSIEVNASRITINCQAISGAAQVGTAANGTFTFHVDPMIRDIQFVPSEPCPPSESFVSLLTHRSLSSAGIEYRPTDYAGYVK